MEFYRPPALQAVLDALGNIHRALRAWKFYPPGHPSRKVRVRQAHASMLSMLDGNDLCLNCGRKNFSFPDGEVIKDLTPISAALSYELFIRRVQKITFLCDLKEEDLLDFLRILALPPENVQKMGGVDKLLQEHGVQTIWTNEFDFSIIKAKRLDIEAAGNLPHSIDEVESSLGMEFVEDQEQAEISFAEQPPLEELPELLSRLAAIQDEDLYLLGVRQAVTCADALKTRYELKALTPLIELLAEHSQDAGRSESMRDCARFGLEQIAMGEELLAYHLDRVDQPGALSRRGALALLAATGPAGIILAAEKLGATENLTVRKEISSLLSGMGEAGLPILLKMMRDHRWYMVRNLSAIVGDIGRQEAVPELLQCLRHVDIRVCKEAVRSLAKIGGREAEAAVIEILGSGNQQLFPQAIASLGGMKSRRALTELLQIVCAKDTFLKNLPLKMDALQAIAAIGDRQAVPVLTHVMARRHLFARKRREQFKVAVATCLGRLADPRALPVLNKFASASEPLGKACNEAIEAIERVRGEQHGSA